MAARGTSAAAAASGTLHARRSAPQLRAKPSPGTAFCCLHSLAGCRARRRCVGKRQSWCPPVAAKGTEDEFPTNDPIWNPDIDDVALDDDYYELIGGDDRGIDTEVDPEAEVLSMDDMERMLRDPQLQSLFAGQWAKGAADGPAEADPPLTSPQVILLAGLRAEELPQVRVLMDQLGWEAARAIPVTTPMLYRPVSEALQQPEPAWDEPRTENWQGGGWGSERILLFSGMPTGAQASLVELLEEAGLPPVSVAAVRPGDQQGSRILGEVLAFAVKEQRSVRRAAARPVWQDATGVVGELEPVEVALGRAQQQEVEERQPEEDPQTTAEVTSRGAAEPTAQQEEGPPPKGDMKQQAAKGPANLIDELAVAVTAPPDDEASGGGSISYADLHYSASSPGRARFKETSREAEPSEPIPSRPSIARLKEVIERAREAGVPHHQLEGVLKSIATARGAPASGRGAEVLEVTEDVRSLLTYGHESLPRPTAAEPPEVRQLKDALSKARAAGVGREQLKAVLAKLALQGAEGAR